MTTRKYIPADCPQIMALFYDTVHTINAADYSRAQLNAWATGNESLTAWNSSFLAHHTVVAVDGQRITGFGDMDGAGYLDRLYVHKDYQRQKIATQICDILEQAAHVAVIYTNASITARPFFEKRGYRVVTEQQVERGGVYLTNYKMEKTMKQ